MHEVARTVVHCLTLSELIAHLAYGRPKSELCWLLILMQVSDCVAHDRHPKLRFGRCMVF